ncbi:hypothetical protein ACIA5C_16775 [Actinoplanes sp. NPDC051343]|uniref:hypothetical protein n=1 Tax=Actinoplanes sp. NPDC051343 TaxID=3363906 RepID=UPI003791AA65
MPTILPGLRFDDLRHTHRTWLDEHNLPEALKASVSAPRSPDTAGSTPAATGNGRTTDTGVTVRAHKQKSTDEEDPRIGALNCENFRGRYWDRTSDLFRVKERS